MINRRGSVKSVFAEMISDWKAAGQRERARRRSAKRRQVNRTPAAGEGLESRLVLSALTISTDVSAVGDITETSPDEATTGDDLTIQSGVTVESQSGLVALNVGDDLFIEAGASVISSQAIGINLDFGDADPGVGSTAAIDGTISSSFTRLNAASDDPINVTLGSAALQAGWEVHGGIGEDTLTLDLTGITDMEFWSDGMNGGSLVSASALIGIEFFSIENINTIGNGFGSFELSNVMVEDASDDTVTVTLDGTGNHFIIQRNGVTVQTVPVSVGELTITGSDDNDTLVIDHSAGIIGATINFVGGNGNDSLVVIGNGTTSSVYTPGATGAGVVTVDGGGGTINFTGLEPVDISGMATATLTLPGANDVLTIADGFDFATGIEPALRVSGTSGGTTIETVAFFDNTNVVIDTSDVDGIDTIDITSASGSHGNENLMITTGGTAGDGDTLLLVGDVTTTGSQTYDKTAVSLTGDAVLTGSQFIFSNGTTIDGAQSLQFSGGDVNADGAIGAVAPLSAVLLSHSLTTNGTFTAAALALSGDANLTAQNILVTGAVDVGVSALTLTQVGTGTMGQVQGIISGSGSLIKAGPGDILLAGANDFSGTTDVDAGELWISHPSALGGTSSGTFVAAGAALYLNGSLTVTGETLFLQGALETGVAPVATWAGPVEISGGSSLMLVDSPGDTLVVSGDITGSDGLTISTDPGGLVQFTGIQSYSGTTNVSGANLRMDGMSTGSDFVVTSGSNLSGSGSIAGAVTVQSGGQLLPGTSPGIISTGNLDLQTGSTLTAEVLGYSTAGTDYDQVDVTGTVTLAGALNLTGAPAAAIGGESITLINNDGSDAVIGTFSNAPVNGSTVTFNGQDWRILYDGGDGNDVVLVFGDAELSIDNVSQAEGTGGSTVFTFTVTLDSAVGAAFSVPYTIAGGSANPGEDFSAILTGSLLFTGTTSGETSTIEVTVTTDDKVELNEDFTVTLGTISGSSVITVTNSVGTGTIQNDDSATLSISDVSVVEGDSGTTDLIFTVSLDHDVDAAVGATVDTADGTATTADGDYVAITGGSVSLSGAAASPSTVTVTVNGDVTLESDETLSVLLSSLTSGGRNVTFGTATAVGTIIDDDRPTVDLSVSAAAGTEADTTVITVTVTSSSPVSGNQTVDLDVAGTGITTNDYILSATTLTINDTETTATATFTVQNDTVVEALETAVISLTNLSSGIRVGSVTSQNIDITDNDAATLSIDDVSVAEGNAGTAALVFTVTLTGDIDTGISVDFASADAMADSSDYTAVTGTLNFAGTTGETQTVTIDVNGDSVVELDETLSLVLSNLQAAGRNVTLSKASGTGTITNDDSATLAINDATIVEGDSGTTTVSLTVTLTGSVDQAFTVGYQTADDAAVAGSDYTAVTGGVLNFAGTDGEMVTLDVNISPDGLVELDEQFLVDLLTVSAGGRSITLADAQGAVTILNDDSPVAVDLSTSVSTATEADQTQVTLTVTAAGAVVGDQTVTVAVTGVAATDFVLSDTTITIPDGQTTGSVTFTIVDDALVELPETATVTISSPSLGVTIGTASQDIAITDNDAATLTISDVSHTEGDSGTTIYTFEITLDSAVDGMFSVDVATADGSAATASGDYFGISGSVDFDGTAGEVKTVEIIVNGDEIVELDETFVVNLSNVSAGGRNVTIADSQGVGTITNDDAATLSINSVSIAEGDSGSSALTFTVTLDSAVDDTVTVNVDSSDGTATTADSDYTANTGSVLTFVGNAGETQTFTVQVMGDTTPEQVETLLATLSNVQANGRAVTIAQAQGTGTIVDDDGAALTLSSDVVGGTEALGTVITITVTADAAVSGAQTVDLVVSGVDSADYLLSGATVTIADGATTGTATFTVQDDAVVELLETAVISLANPTAGVSIATSNTLSLTITDNDSATLSIDDVTIAESNSGTTTATFTVTLDASADADVTVDFTTAGDTATVADSDYAAASGTLTFSAGSAAGSTQTITVDITGDVKVEADETFFVNLSNVQSGGRNVTIADAQGVATITNDDSATISVSDVTLNEGNAGTTTFTFTATLSGEVDTAVSVDYATQDGTATVADNDYIAAAATTLTFAANAGTGNQTLTFDITVNGDVAQEVLETFLVNLSNLTFGTGTRSVTISDATGVGSIVNDDGILVNLGATASTGTEADGTSITLVITAASPVVGNQTVDLVVSGTGIDSADYTLSTVTIQIPDGQTIGTATFTVANDTVVEPTETATISLTNLSAGISAGAISSVNMDITSDDAATVSINDVTLAEGNSGETLFVFTVTLDNAVSGGFSVDYSTADGTTIPAVAGTDYTAVSGTLTFAGTAGETMQISVPVLGDLTSEEAETFFVNLSNVAASGLNVTIADAQGLGTITNDDSTEVTLQLSAGTGSEAAGTVITITATTAQPVSGNQTVDVQVTGTGITAGDYVLSSTTIQIADGQTSGTVTLTVAADTSIEGTETATLSLVSPSSGLTLGSPIAADLVISDNSTVTLDAVSRFPGSSPTLTWQSVPGAARYEVWFSRITPSPARVYLDSNVTTTSWTPPDVLPTAFYKYWVRAVDAAGNAGAWSTPNTFEVKPTLIGPLTPVFSARPTFAWNPVPFATSYQLFLRTTSGDIIHNNIVGTSFTPTTDLPTGVIRWWIRATDHTGNRGWSDAGVTNTDKRAIVTGPTSPTTVTPPTITWTGVVGAGRYVLHVINVATNEVVIRQDNLTGTSYTPPTALPAAGYRIWVKAIDAETNLFSSGVWSRAYNLTITASESQAENSAALVSLGPDVQDQLSGDAATERTQPVDIATAAEKSSSTDETTLARNEAKSSLIRNSGVQSVPISAGDRPSPVVQELQLLDALMAQPLDLVALFDQQKANV